MKTKNLVQALANEAQVGAQIPQIQRAGDRVLLPYNEIAVFSARIPEFYRTDLAELRTKSRILMDIIEKDADSRHYWRAVISRRTVEDWIAAEYDSLLEQLAVLETPFVVKKTKVK